MHDSASPCCFLTHPNFSQELDDFLSHHGVQQTTAEEVLEHHERLFLQHFYNSSPMFTNKHLGPAQGFSGFEVYWLHMVIPNSNLSRTQMPKSYFYKTENHISFLCLNSHLQNYKDSKLRAVATKRLSDMLEVIKAH